MLWSLVVYRRTCLSRARDQSRRGWTGPGLTWRWRELVAHWMLILASYVTLKGLWEIWLGYTSERNQLFTALMEWNVNLSQLMTALFSSSATGHYWVSAFFPLSGQFVMPITIRSEVCRIFTALWIFSHLMDDCSHSTDMSTYAGDGNWRMSTYTIVKELLNFSAPFVSAQQ